MALLGFNENLGEVGLPRWAGIKSLDIGLEEVTDTTQKRMLHFAGTYTVESAFAKVFGPLFKGTVKGINQNVMNRFGKVTVGGESVTSVLAQANIDQSNMLISEGSMIKKGPAYLVNQMVGGATLITGQDAQAFRRDVDRLTKSKLGAVGYHNESIAFKRQHKYIMSVVEATAEGIAKSGQPVNPKLAGMVFAGAFKHIDKIASRAGVSDGQAALEAVIRKTLGGGSADQIIKVAKEGIALGLGYLGVVYRQQRRCNGHHK